MKNAAVASVAFAATASCAWLADTFPTIAEVASNPEIQEGAGKVVEHAATGNWVGAVLELGKLVGTGLTTWALVEANRDRKRKKRGEPVGGKGAATP